MPLLFHAGYGLAILRQGRPELLRYPYLRNRLYWFQRVSGVGILAFLLLHVGLTRFQGLLEPAVRVDLYGHMQRMLAQPWFFSLYLIGLLLAVFHLANGLATMGIVWGLTTSARAQALAGFSCVGLGLVLSILGLHGMIGFLP